MCPFIENPHPPFASQTPLSRGDFLGTSSSWHFHVWQFRTSDFQLKVILPSEIDQMKNLEVNAVSKWRKKDLNPDLCKIGGQLTDVKKKETTIIDRLVEA